VCTFVIPATREVEIGGSKFQTCLSKRGRPYLKSKLTQNDWWHVSSGRSCKALSPTPSVAQNVSTRAIIFLGKFHDHMFIFISMILPKYPGSVIIHCSLEDRPII
jgi:hypothetical protein